MEVYFDGRQHTMTMAASLPTGTSRIVENRAKRGYWRLTGPRGGKLSSEGFGMTRDLIETLHDGRKQTYGRFPFAVGDGRAGAGCISADGKRAIPGFRPLENPRFRLSRIEGHL